MAGHRKSTDRMRPTRRARWTRRRGARRTAGIVLAATALLGTAAWPGPVAADEPTLVPWTAALPGLETRYDPASENICLSGKLSCVDAVLREMDRRFRPLARDCSHDAIFSLIYLRTTEAYRRAVTTPGFFADPGFLNHYDAVFAKFYFKAEDAWRGGRHADVPPAWQVAFDVADRGAVTGAGNLLLGMNAHINRDLPFVLDAIGLVAPDGTSRKADHDRVNVFLNRVGDAELAELARRFDPAIDDGSVQGSTLDNTTKFQIVQVWREQAWRNAERLTAARARSQAEYDAVAADIERAAEAEARSLVTTNAYSPPLSSRAGRDTWCATHWDEA